MGSRRVFWICANWRRTLLPAVAIGIAPAFLAGCYKPNPQEAAPADAEVVGVIEIDAGEVTPPPPVVAADPDVPLNEAVVGTKPVAADYAADMAPPAPAFEEAPPSPGRGHVWVPGYWWWSRPYHRYVWVSGAWRNPPPDHFWTPGSWVEVSPQRYVWSPGFWATRGYAPEGAIDLAPPPPRFEAYGASPGVGFAWTPGYYAYRNETYVWTPGSWLRPPEAGLSWVEPRYVEIGGRYHFQPGRWDHAPEQRGTVYQPDVNARAGTRIGHVAVPSAVVAAHANFVAASAHAIAQGATRTPSGGYAVHGGGNIPQGNSGPKNAPVPTTAPTPRPAPVPMAAPVPTTTLGHHDAGHSDKRPESRH